MAWEEFPFRNKPGDGFWLKRWHPSRWQFHQVSFQLIGVIAAVIALIWLASGTYIVGPDQRGIVLRFGRHVTSTDPGVHWHWPYPFEGVLRPKVTEVQRIEIGFRTTDPGPPARYAQIPSEALMLTGDENIIDINLAVQYRITNPAEFLFRVRGLTDTVKSASEASLREVIGRRQLDEALTAGKFEIQEETKTLLQSILNTYQAGLQIVAVQLQDVQPPKQVGDAFKDVASAREDKVRLINEADGYRRAIIPEVRGKVETVLREAEGYREEKVRRAQGDAQRFLLTLSEYQTAKEITRKRLVLETLEEVLPQMDKFILENGSGANLLRILPFSPRDAQAARDGSGAPR